MSPSAARKRPNSKICIVDHACARNVCPRPRFCLHHTRHSAKMRIWWPVTSHQVPLFALSGGSWAAKSKATKPPARPMIERTRTWSQPNHPPAVLDNFGGGPPVPGGRMPKPSWTTPRCRAQARQAQARQFRCASRLPALLTQAKQADHPTHAETESWSNLTNAPSPQTRPRSCFVFPAVPLVRSFASASSPMPTPPPRIKKPARAGFLKKNGAAGN